MLLFLRFCYTIVMFFELHIYCKAFYIFVIYVAILILKKYFKESLFLLAQGCIKL